VEGDTPVDELDIFTFDPWPDPAIDPYGEAPDSTWSRLGWLPIIGPSSWLIWGTLAAQLRTDPQVTWPLPDLAGAHGLGASAGRHAPTRRALARLSRFRLLVDCGDGRFLVRLTAPPLGRRHLERLPEFVSELQRQIFETPRLKAS